MTTVTAELVADQQLPSEVQVSPEGGWIAFSVAPLGQKGEHPASAIWVASPGDAAAPLTAGSANDHVPQWSPDSRTLYFLSDREKRGVDQLYRINPERGEATRLTDWEPGIAAYAPLANNKRVALLAVDPETAKQKRRKEERDDAEVYGEDWPFQRLRLLDLASGEITTPALFEDRHVVDIVAEPDGARLLARTWPTPETDNGFWRNAIDLVDLETESAIRICEHPACVDGMAFGPEGAIVLLATPPGHFHAGGTLWSVPATGGEPRELFPGQSVSPVELVPTGGGDLLVTVWDGLNSWIARLDVAADALEPVQQIPGEAVFLSASRDGQLLAVMQRTPHDPGHVLAGSPGRPWATRSDLNPAFRDVAWGAHEAISWLAPDGTAIDGVLLLPAGATRADGPFPLVVSVHGGPYWRFADGLVLDWELWGQWLATAGYAVFMANPRGSSGRGSAFAAEVLGAPGESDWADIESGLDELVRQGIADPERLGIGGWSYGGFMTAWALGHSDRFRCGIMGAGVSDWGMMVATGDIPSFSGGMGGSLPWSGAGPHQHVATSPISFAHRVTTPTLIPHGGADVRVPLNQGQFFAQALREHSVPCELVVYPREGHLINERQHQLDLLTRVRAWVARWLGPGWKAD
ncbi:MAG: S9 family peptidase [Thermomicrobiales bacterium]